MMFKRILSIITAGLFLSTPVFAQVNFRPEKDPIVRAINGIVKSNGSTISAASQGTDYYAPSGTDVAVADGGTGASDASGARTNLGLVIGANVQAYDTDLTTYAGIAPSSNVQSLLGAVNYAAIRKLLDVISSNKIAVIASDGTISEFSTLQTAFDSIPAATDASERRVRYMVYVPAGDYDEALTIKTFRRNITVIALGMVNIGQFDNSLWEASNTRDLILDHYDDSDDGTEISGILDSITFTTYYHDDGMPSHSTSYKAGFRISGGVSIIDSKLPQTQLVSFHHVRVFGTVDFTDHTALLAFYTSNSFYNAFTGSTTSTAIYVAHACKFVGAVSMFTYYNINFSRFYDDITVGSAPSFTGNQPFGFYNSFLEGNFTGPDNSLILDSSTNYYFVQNGGELLGDAKKVLLDAYTPSGVVTSGNIMVADGTKFESVAMSGDATISSLGALTIGSNKITESMLKAVDSASDEDVMTYESTTGDFEWHSRDEIVAGISAGALPNDSILEADLKAVDVASDEECLTYESTTGDFEWQTCGGGGGGAPTDADYLVGTANGSLSAEIVVGTSPGGELGGTWASPTIDDSVTVTGWVLGTSSATQITSPTVIVDLLDANGAVDMDYGSADVTDHTFTTDGTGTAEIVMPAGSIDSTEVLDNTLTSADMADSLDFGGDTSFEIPNSTSPTVDAAGEIAVDTTDDQLVYHGVAKRVIAYERVAGIVIEDLAATDDNFAFFMANDAITITGVGCNCRGTCSTLATFTLEDRGGNAMTITGTNPTCATTGAATFAAVTAGNQLTAGEMLAFDVTNTPTASDEYGLYVTYTVDAQ